VIARAALSLLVATTIFAVALASSSVGELILVGRPARWVMLGALGAVSVAGALLVARRRLPLLAYALPFGLLLVAYDSAGWSVDPSLTARRATAFAALLVTGAALASLAAARPEVERAVLVGILLGATALALGGLAVLGIAHGDAVQAADTQSPARYQGLGGNPNTAAMLLALGVPLALSIVLEARRVAERVAAAAALLLLAGSVVASGSRGALIAALVGALVLVAAVARGRRRLVLAAATAAAFGLGVWITQLPKPLPRPVHRAAASTPPVKPTFEPNAERQLPLSQEIGAENGAHPSIRRRLFGSSGRSQAWAGALHTWERRPVAGYGFGTEERAFVDRYYTFDSGLPENSYIGTLLQLGVVGLALLVAAALWALARFRLSPPAAALLAGGLVLGLTQSYLFAVGNDATIPVWLAWFMLAAAAARRARAPRTRAPVRAPAPSSAPPRGGSRSRA
jgi:O-antigen ligase